jgi:hypothetical protein
VNRRYVQPVVESCLVCDKIWGRTGSCIVVVWIVVLKVETRRPHVHTYLCVHAFRTCRGGGVAIYLCRRRHKDSTVHVITPYTDSFIHTQNLQSMRTVRLAVIWDSCIRYSGPTYICATLCHNQCLFACHVVTREVTETY